MKVNKLSINYSKTEYIIITGHFADKGEGSIFRNFVQTSFVYYRQPLMPNCYMINYAFEINETFDKITVTSKN